MPIHRDETLHPLAGLENLDEPLFNQLLPSSLDRIYELGDMVSISARLTVFRGQLQLRMILANPLKSQQYLDFANNDADRLYKDFYNSKIDFSNKQKPKDYSNADILKLMKLNFKDKSIPDAISLCEYMMQHKIRDDDLTDDELKINITSCFQELLLDNDVKLYQTIVSLIRDYTGNNEGIAFDDILKALKFIPEYECFRPEGLKAYMTNALSRSDFIEADDNQYMIV